MRPPSVLLDFMFTVSVRQVWTVKDGAAAKATVVTAISKAPGQGLHSPVLTHGRLPVVDGLVTSFDSIGMVRLLGPHRARPLSHAMPWTNRMCHALGALQVRLAHFGLAPLITACKQSGTCAKFRELFLAGDRKYVADTLRRAR